MPGLPQKGAAVGRAGKKASSKARYGSRPCQLRPRARRAPALSPHLLPLSKMAAELPPALRPPRPRRAGRWHQLVPLRSSPPPAEASHLPVWGVVGPALRPGFSRLRPLFFPAGGRERAGPRSERFPRPRPGAPARQRLPLVRSAVRPPRRARARTAGGGAGAAGGAGGTPAAGSGSCAPSSLGGEEEVGAGGGPARPGGRIRGASWPGWIFYRSQNGARSKPAQRPAAATATAGPGLTSARRRRRPEPRAGSAGTAAGGRGEEEEGVGGEAQRRTEPPGTPCSLPPSPACQPLPPPPPSLPPSPTAPPSPSLANRLRQGAALPRSPHRSRTAPLLLPPPPLPRACPRPPARDELLACPRRTLGGQSCFFGMTRTRPYPRMRKANSCDLHVTKAHRFACF
ncbi:uncharacterized protein LOC142060290 [Phalacrocorax aristotelis]|uniref:uncharacterized protein LOC142060290 n=1 Tax=Phalacrocorax aristotelis TaxID=126867 RepID=UPI003F4B6C17